MELLSLARRKTTNGNGTEKLETENGTSLDIPHDARQKQRKSIHVGKKSNQQQQDYSSLVDDQCNLGVPQQYTNSTNNYE